MSPSNYDRRVRRGLGVPQDYDPQAGPVADQSEPEEEPGPPRVAPRPMASYTDEDYAAAAPWNSPKPAAGEPGVAWSGGPTKAPAAIKAPPQLWAGASLPESEDVGPGSAVAPAGLADTSAGTAAGTQRAATMGPPPVTMRQAPTPPPAGPPPPGEQEKAYQAMLQMGPRRSVLGTIAGAAMRFGAGYQNAGRKIGQDSIHLDQQRLDDWAQRNPMGPGSWREGVGRQKALSDAEQAQTKSDQDWQNQQVKNEDFRSQARERDKLGDFYGAHAGSVRQDSDTRAAREQDQVRDNAMKRIHDVGGNRGVQIQKYKKSEPQPVGFDAYLPDPDNPTNGMVAVRPHPGLRVDEETGKSMGVQPDADGSYYLDAATVRNYKTNQTRSETSANTLTAKTQADAERAAEFKARMDEIDKRNELLRGQIQDRKDEKDERRGAEIESHKNDELRKADAWAAAELDKVRGTMGGQVPQADADRIYGQAAQMKQRAMDLYTGNVQRRGGHASSWKVSADRNGNYKFDETPEAPAPAPGPPRVAPPASNPRSGGAPYLPGDPVTGPDGRAGVFQGINPQTGNAIVKWN